MSERHTRADSAVTFDIQHTCTHPGILSLYLTVLCVLNICSLVATLMNPIPYPNSILFYNFALLGLAYVFHQYLEGMCPAHTCTAIP